jgi:hypothetical protein
MEEAVTTCEHCSLGALRIKRHGKLQHLSNISGCPAWWDCTDPDFKDKEMTPNDIHPRTPLEISAQLWTLKEHSGKVMDVSFARSIATEIEREQKHTDAWYDTAAQHCRNEEYYRGLLVKIGEMIGEAAYISYDGSRQQDVLCAKIPELVALMIRELDHAKR